MKSGTKIVAQCTSDVHLADFGLQFHLREGHFEHSIVR